MVVPVVEGVVVLFGDAGISKFFKRVDKTIVRVTATQFMPTVVCTPGTHVFLGAFHLQHL